jgi:2,3-bisphosphoglycerate-independent phosphoglycerate mutase
MGAGLPMDKGDVAFKCNFATVQEDESGQMIVERRRVDRNFPSWGIELCSFLDGLTLPDFPGLVVATKYATEHRCGIVFKGPGLCDKITGTDPLKDQYVVDTAPDSNTVAAVLIFDLLNVF